MRKVFSSRRLENTEGVATLLREAGIEVRIINGRSYKGNRRGTFSYSDPAAPMSEVWVVRSDQQRQARELLREAGLIDTTRPGGSYTFRSTTELAEAKSPARKRMLRIKLGLLGVIGAVVVAGAVHTLNQPPPVPTEPAEAELAAPPFDGSVAATLPAVARAAFASELGQVDTPFACLGIDGGDAPPAMIAALSEPVPGLKLVPASACVEIADEDRGSYERAAGQPAMIVDVGVFRPSAPDHATVEINAYHHRGWASYKTLEVARRDGQWQVVQVLKHVESRGLMGF